nr:TCR gamma alternate reading frame protein [Meriones unguiculatus]
MLLLRGFAFSCLWVFGLRQLEQTEMSVTGLTDKSGQIPCKVSLPDFGNAYIHWYRQKTNQELEYLLYFKTSYHQLFLDGKNKKIEAGKDFLTSTSTLKVNFLKKEDEATYYCAAWILSSWIMVFGSGTKLRVIPSGKLLGSDISPKPTIFLPSVAETNHDKAGTYLCLLEKFFPDVIRVYWKKKNGDQILKSQEGKAALKTENDVTTIKVNPRESASKWENGNNSADMEACKEEIKDVLQLQLTNTSAFYNYLILFFKSLVHLAFVVFCLLRRRTAVPCSGPSS